MMMAWTFELYGKDKKLIQNLCGKISWKAATWKGKMGG
jgi:hypothetical protein